MRKLCFSLLSLLIVPLVMGQDGQARPTRDTGFRLVDLSLGESAEVTLADGKVARVKLLALDEKRDSVKKSVREARVKIEVNGVPAELFCSHYHLPREIGGVKVDCPITRGHYEGVDGDPWGLVKDARLRLWPKDAALTEPGAFAYPLDQSWFASATSMANEPIDAGVKSGYVYHYDLDFGGAEGLTQVRSATDGLVVSSADETLPGHEDSPVRKRYDVIYLLDDRGFYYRYSHFHRIDESIKPGRRVKLGDKLGLLGKQGGSGGWSHLHFGLWMRMPSGKWGSLDAYPLVWEAYLRERQPPVIAVARPGHVLQAGESITLDGTKSFCADGSPPRYHWTFSDGSGSKEAHVSRSYASPGRYSEVLKVENARGAAAYDFVRVIVVDPAQPEVFPADVHASFWPSEGLKAGDEVTIKVRSFRAQPGREKIDLGDGSAPVFVQSRNDTGNLDPNGYATHVHRYEKPGDYIVRIDREDDRGWPAFTHLHIRVLPR